MISIELSPQVRRVADRLIAASIGETVSHGSLSDAAGQDILERRHWVTSALRVAQREAGAVFVCERNVGYRRLRPDELSGVGVASRRHIRSTARSAQKSMVAGLRGANDIDDSAKSKITAELASCGLLLHLASDRVVVRHEAEPSPEAVAEVARTTMMRLQAALKK